MQVGVADYSISGSQINEMRKDIAFSGGKKMAREVVVDLRGQGRYVLRAGGEGVQDLRLALVAVGDQEFKPFRRGGNGLAMAGQKTLPGAVRKAAKRGHVGPHVAVGWCDNRGSPAHDMIAGKERLAQSKAEVPAEMAGSVKSGKGPVRAGEAAAVGQAVIRGEGQVQSFATVGQAGGEAGHQSTAAVKRVAVGVDRGASGRSKAWGKGGMVAVGMCDNDVADLLPGPECSKDSVKMIRTVGAGIDQSNFGRPDQPGVGPGPGQGGRVRGTQEADRRRAGHRAVRLSKREGCG